MNEEELILSIDIGGTHFRMGLCSSNGSIISHESLPTATLDSATSGLKSLAKNIDPTQQAKRVVVGVPGIVNYTTQELLFAPNIPQNFISQLTGARISDALQLPSLLVNDADLAAIGECYFGAGNSFTSFAYVTISTGVGAAVITNRKLVHTQYSLAELGHSYISANYSNPSHDGSVEYLASGTAMARLAKLRGISLSNEDLIASAKNGDHAAESLIDEIAWHGAVALANIVHFFSIDAIVLGGGVILSGEYFFDRITSHFESLRPKYIDVKLLLATLGDNAGLVGGTSAHLAL